MFKKLISLFLSFTLIFTQPLFAQGVAQLNLGSYLSTVGQSIATDRFRPLHMRYFSYDLKADNFQLLLDKGDNKDIKEPELQEKTKVLMEYFQIGLSLPNDKFWVNLRPDAQDEMIDPELEKTDMGKIMLEADLQLKRDTAQATSPQTPEGKAYWDKLYKKAGELFGTENITIPTITRPWIVPGEVILRQGEDSAYIFKANMKVMLEHDYIDSQSSGPNSKPLTSNYNFSDPRMKELNEYSTQLIRELIIPRLTKEVNSSKRYAALRQVFFSLVMARWFKDTFSGKPGQYAKLIDSHNLNSLTSKQAWDKAYYFNEYKKSFEQGEYNLKENITTPTGQVIRSYVSGGIIGMSSAMEDNPHKGAYHGVGDKETHLVAASVGYKYPGIGHKNKMFYVEYSINNGKKVVSAPLQMNQNDTVSSLSNNKKKIPGENLVGLKSVPYNNYYLTYLLKKLSRSDTIDGKIDYLQRIKEWIQSKRYEILSYNIRVEEIMDEIILHLAEKNENEKEVSASQAAAEIITLIIGLEGITNVPISDGNGGIIYSVGPAKKFLSNRHIEKIVFLINEGIKSSKPYLASEALGVILFMAAESKIEANRIKSLSYVRKLAELLLGQGMPHQEIKTKFLEQVEDIRAIKVDQEKSREMRKTIDEAQESLVRLSEKLRKELEEKLLVIVKDIEKILNEDELSGRKNRGEIDIPEDSFKGISKILSYLNAFNREGTRIKIKEGEIDDIIKIISESGLRNNPPEVYKAYSGLRLLTLESSISELEKLKKDWQEFNRLSSSAIETAVSGSPAKDVGGIDFRTMNYLVEPMGSFKDLRFGLPTLTSSALERIDLDKELASLRDMVKAGMVPSGERVKEYLAACFQKGKIEEKQDDLLVCLAEIYRLAEEENLETSPELRESLVIVDTGKFVLLPNNQKVGLS